MPTHWASLLLRPAEAAVSEFSEKLVWDQLKKIYDPEIPINVVDLGLIYSCQITPAEVGYKINVKMTLTAPGCGMANVLRVDVERRLAKLPHVREVHVEVVFDPPWQPNRMSEAAKTATRSGSRYWFRASDLWPVITFTNLEGAALRQELADRSRPINLPNFIAVIGWIGWGSCLGHESMGKGITHELPAENR